MKRFATLLAPLLATAVLLVGCKKDKVEPKDQLPPATTTGANTWGCLVNGEVWQASGLSHVRADWTTRAFMSLAMGVPVQSGAKNISFSFPDTTQSYTLTTGRYLLERIRDHNHVWMDTPARSFTYEDTWRGEVIISRLDRQAGIASGTFEFTMVGAPGDTVRVTDGRFDVGNMDR